jgi:uncharacterized membrane protein
MDAPKPARESRTLRFNAVVSGVVTALAALPTLLSYVLELLGDPSIAAAVSDAVPARYRALIAAVVLIVAQRNRALRMQTSAPIAEKWLATDDPPQPPDVPRPECSKCERLGYACAEHRPWPSRS